MILTTRIERLREAVAEAQPDPSQARPSFVHIVFVNSLFGKRTDVKFEWVAGGAPCWVHTDHRNPRKAVKQVQGIAEHVRPGRRFRASDPTNFDTHKAD